MSETNQINEEKKPGFFARLEAKVNIYRGKLQKFATIILLSSIALVFIESIVIRAFSLSKELSLYILLTTLSGAAISLLISAFCFVLSLFFTYRNIQKFCDEERNGLIRYIFKPLKWVVKKPSLWSLIGSIIILIVTSGQFSIASIFNIRSDYNYASLICFGIANSLLVAYALYTIYAFVYQLIASPFEDKIEEFLAFSIAPYKSPLKTFGVFTGGFALYIILMLTAITIDARMYHVSIETLRQMSEFLKMFADQPKV